jgi:hypothetical protein
MPVMTMSFGKYAIKTASETNPDCVSVTSMNRNSTFCKNVNFQFNSKVIYSRRSVVLRQPDLRYSVGDCM